MNADKHDIIINNIPNEAHVRQKLMDIFRNDVRLFGRMVEFRVLKQNQRQSSSTTCAFLRFENTKVHEKAIKYYDKMDFEGRILHFSVNTHKTIDELTQNRNNRLQSPNKEPQLKQISVFSNDTRDLSPSTSCLISQSTQTNPVKVEEIQPIQKGFHNSKLYKFLNKHAGNRDLNIPESVGCTLCPNPNILCKHCGLEFKLNQIKEHEKYCGSRNEECHKCRRNVLLFDLEFHVRTCGTNLDNSYFSRTFKARCICLEYIADMDVQKVINLECGHMACRGCLKDLGVQDPPHGQVKCPFCNKLNCKMFLTKFQ